MNRRRWRHLERRAIIGHQQDLQRALRALGAGRSPILATEVTQQTGSSVVLLSLPRHQLSLAGVAPSGVGALRRLAAGWPGALVVGDAGRYGPLWWVAIFGERESCTLLGVAVDLRPNSGGDGEAMVEHPAPGRLDRVADTLLGAA